MSLKKYLRGVIPDDKISLLSDRYEVIGDVAIVTIPPGLEAYKEDIAVALLSQRRNIRTVLRMSGKRQGDERVADYEVLIGTGTTTEHREFGYRYRLDVARVFFNSRLATERMRVAGHIMPGERILIPFCGVGPFVVPAAARGASVVAVEKNPDAFSWLSGNLELNHVADRVSVFCDDAFRIPDLVKPGFDRVISPTPYGLDSILDLLSGMTRPGGMIHFYTFKSGTEIESLKETYRKKSLIATACHHCGFVAPGIGRYVFDLKKE
ncbi:MAG: RsmD family RNA methyltransferase [Methanoregulaceae archaeon]|nr:RsmD family RNA methyltransferase [Methanoregulaceae archaeon]